MRNQKTERAAEVVQEVVKTFSHFAKIEEVPSYKDLDPISRESLINSVAFITDNNITENKPIHDIWLEKMLKMGWTYGKDFDLEKKTHPSLVPFSNLPPEERAVDKLFRSVLKSINLVL